jgi:hypothetical protein
MPALDVKTDALDSHEHRRKRPIPIDEATGVRSS